MNPRNRILTLLIAGVTATVLLAAAARAEFASTIQFSRGMTAYNMGEFGKAALIWGRLAENGSAIAQSGLGLLYYTGSGVPRNYARARALFLAAAQQNVPQAQMFLSLMYRRGEGMRQSYILSYMWCDIAVGAGHEEASYICQNIAEHLTGGEVLEAQRLSSEWREFNFK